MESEVGTDEVRLSGDMIAKTLLRIVGRRGLSLDNCVGQGYDGASSLSSERVGAAACFKRSAPNARYFHCALHRLNLSATSTIAVPAITHAQDVMKSTTACFNSSAKRICLLQSCIEKADDTRISKNNLKTL